MAGLSFLDLPNGEMYLLRPVLNNCIKYTDLKDGSIDLYDIALLNDAIYIDVENKNTIQEYFLKQKE